jgi:hypothetical protein
VPYGDLDISIYVCFAVLAITWVLLESNPFDQDPVEFGQNTSQTKVFSYYLLADAV